jgi:hypothetical protein
MAIYTIENSVITVNGVDLSDHCTMVEVSCSQDIQDATTMVAAGTALGTVKRAGKRDDSIQASFLNDFAAGEVYATLWDLFDDKTVFEVEVRATDAAAGATNPVFEAQCVIGNFSPIAGNVGDLSSTDVTFEVSGVVTPRITGT